MKAVLYARVSSKEQEQEGFSIPAQLRLLKEYALKKNIEIVQEFVDVETAKQAGRTKFGEMVGFLMENPSTRIVLVEKTDRLYRNFRDYVTIADLGVEIHLVKEGEVLSRDSRSYQKLVHDIRLVMAKNYIDNLSEEVQKGLAEKARQGDFPHKAPFGYRNNTTTRTLDIDEPNAQIVRRLFELYASGQYSLKGLRNQAMAEGLVRPSGRPFGISELEYILKNPIYYGMFRWKSTLYRGNHPPLITKALFDQAQAVFGQANKPRLTAKSFAFRGLLLCGHCGCQLTAEVKKHRYIYYRCTNAKGKCRQPYLREEVVDTILAEVVKGIQLTAEDAEFLREGLKESLRDQEAYHHAQLKSLAAQYSQLQRRLEQIYLDRIEGKVDEAFWRKMTAQWQQEQEQVRQALAQHEQASAAYFEEGVLLLELAQQAYSVYVAAPIEKKRKILNLLLSNCVLKDTTPIPTYRTPFDILAQGVETKEWLPSLDTTKNFQAQSVHWLRQTERRLPAADTAKMLQPQAN